MRIKRSILTLIVAASVMCGIMIGANATETLEAINAYLNRSIIIRYNAEVQDLKDANGNRIYPITYQGSTYLPVRAVANMLCLDVNWDEVSQTVWLGSGFTPTAELNSDNQKQDTAILFKNLEEFLEKNQELIKKDEEIMEKLNELRRNLDNQG